MVHAFYIVEQLAHNGFAFTFKGGTCLSLVTDRIDRMSIDVDIEVQDDVTHEMIEIVLDKIIGSGSVFTQWERQIRPNDRAGSLHYKISYALDDGTSGGRFEVVILDVVRVSSIHPCLTARALVHSALLIEDPLVRVVTPTIEGLLGDKLTACAPCTVGVPIEPINDPASGVVHNKHLEMIKQLFDVNVLIPLVSDWDAVRESFHRTLDVQRGVFGQQFTMDDVVRDLARRALAMFDQLPEEYHPALKDAHEAGHTSFRN